MHGPGKPTGCSGGKKRGVQETPGSSLIAREGVMKRAAMLRSGLDPSRNHSCLPRATPAAFPGRNCKQPLLRQLQAAPKSWQVPGATFPQLLRQAGIPPSPPGNPKAPPALPKMFPLPFAGIPQHLVERIKAGPKWRGSCTTSGCTSGTAAHLFPILNPWAAARGPPVTLLVSHKDRKDKDTSFGVEWPEHGASPLGRAQI